MIISFKLFFLNISNSTLFKIIERIQIKHILYINFEIYIFTLVIHLNTYHLNQIIKFCIKIYK